MMHLVIDNESKQILAVESTAGDVHDCEVFETPIESIPNQIDKALVDRAYGTVWAAPSS